MANAGDLIVGLDIGTTKIGAIVGEINASGAIDIVGIGTHPSKGLRKGTSKPDVYVAYYGAHAERVSINPTHSGYGSRYGYGYYGHWGGTMGGSTTSVSRYTVGSLVVDMWNAGSKQLMWRGTAEDTVSENPSKNEDKVVRAVNRMFLEFPPSTK